MPDHSTKELYRKSGVTAVRGGSALLASLAHYRPKARQSPRNLQAVGP